jgi:TolA-binding protein
VRRLLWTGAIGLLVAASIIAQDKKPAEKKTKDSPAAASTRKKLDTKISVDYKDERLEDIIKDLKSKVENLSIWPDNAGGVSNNITITYKADDKSLAEVLDEMFKSNDLGYLIGQTKDKRYDGWLLIKKGKFRGDEEIPKTTAKDPPKDKEKDKDKAKPADKKPPEQTGDKTEQEAALKLKYAKKLQDDGIVDKAKERYQEIVKKFPKTEAAKEAQKLLEKLNK